MKIRIFALYIFMTIGISGCTLYQKPVVPETQTPEKFKVAIENPHPYLNNHWWENFQNSQLNELVDKALAKNYNYLIALKNIDIAQTYVLQNMTNLFPQLGADFETSRNKRLVNVGNSFSAAPQLTGTPNVNNLQFLTATVNYEIDAWNQVRNSVNQAEADKATVTGNTNVIRLTLVSSVVNNYYQLMALTENIENLKKQLKAAKGILELTKVKYTSGLIDDGDVLQAKNQVENILSTLKTTQKQKQITEYTLAYLLGEYPETFSVNAYGSLSDLKFAELVPEGIPSTMLGIRPDIQAAYSSVLSFGYIEKQNIANFLPNLSLTGSYGYANANLSSLIKQSNAIWTYGLSALQSIFDYPNLYAVYKRSKIQYESAIMSYENTVVNAFAEVDSALISFKEDDLVRRSFVRQVNNYKDLVDIASAHYVSGLTDYLDYLANDLLLLQTDYNLTLKELILTQDIVQVYKTLGLGTEEATDDSRTAEISTDE